MKTLVLSGGGINGITILGCLHAINNTLDDLDNYIGSSIGSVIAFLLIIGYIPSEILERFLSSEVILDFDTYFLDGMYDINNSNLISIDALFNVFKTFYMDKGVTEDTSLLELYTMTGKRFECSAYNLTTKSLEYFSYETHPEESVIKVIKASCSIPIVFGTYNIKGNDYIDGCICESLPLGCLMKFTDREIIAINLIPDLSTEYKIISSVQIADRWYKHLWRFVEDKIKNIAHKFYILIEFYIFIVQNEMSKRCISHLIANNNMLTVYTIETKNPGIGIQITNELISSLFIEGYTNHQVSKFGYS